MRPSHWVKNVFVLPGIVVALSIEPGRIRALHPLWILLGLVAVSLVASSNYVLNELLDAPFDRAHPRKCGRAVPSGRVHVPLGWAQWIVTFLAGLAAGWPLGLRFELVLAGLWILALLYNVAPLRLKDLPYLDVLSEAANNPVRMLAGWYMTGTEARPVTSLLISYWMVGAYFMAVKRLAEWRDLRHGTVRTDYRKSLGYYNERRLLVSILFYASHAMLFLGAFIVRYRIELILAFPLVAAVMAEYLSLSFNDNSAAQRPEGLYREPRLMLAVILCSALMAVLLFVDVPLLHQMFTPTVPRLK